MSYILPPSVTPSHQIAYADVRQVFSRSPQDEATKFAAAIVSSAIPQRVQNELEVILLSLPEIEISQEYLVAQAGPVKPGNVRKPKPTDPPPPPIVPPSDKGTPVNVVADRQEYNTKTQIFKATGNVVIRYQKSELKADRVEVNLVTKTAVADGNVFFTRGDQKFRGSRLEYDYGKSTGSLANASGTVNLETFNRAEPSTSAADLAPGSITLSLGRDTPANAPNNKGIRRLGFQADLIKLNGDRWEADNLRLTNDPFSPPEVELRTAKATLTPISPTQDRLEAQSPTLVFDQFLSIPLPVSTIILDRFQRSFPLLVGYDRQDRGGLFYQQDFDVIARPDLSFQISPQLFVQRGLEKGGNLLDFSFLGLAAKLDSDLKDGQSLSGRATLSSLNLIDVQNQVRANVAYSRPIFGDHSLVAQYSYRERLYNGSLGFQDVRNSIGVNVFSPNKILGNSGISFSYQAGAQYITADRGDYQPVAIGSLARFQGAVALSKGFNLWRGTPLPPEKEAGLKYSPEPVVPGVDAVLGVSGVYSVYSSGNTQGFLAGTIGLSAVLGNFSRPFFDYTKINISYTQGVVAGESPFLFDRIADRQTLSAGILQQIYGPIRFGVQQTWNPLTGKVIDSSYTLEYSRRTYALVIRYNPTREIGELVLRISDFNWTDPPSNVTPVQGGIERRD